MGPRATGGRAAEQPEDLRRRRPDTGVDASATAERPPRRPEPRFSEEFDDTPEDFGRFAAAIARQLIMQRLRDAEDEQKYGEFSGKVGDIVSGVIQQGSRPGDVMIDLGKIEALLPAAERVAEEKYAHGERIKAYVYEVEKGMRGPRVKVSRTHPNLVRLLFALEAPEIADGSVEIVAIAREAGHRSKIAVRATVPGVNAKGACIGPMGQRVRNVMHELHGEKIDIVDYSEDPAEFIAHALSPSQVKGVTLVDPPPARPAWSCRTSSCPSPSARRARTPASPPSSPAGASTSARTLNPRVEPAPHRCDAAPPSGA